MNKGYFRLNEYKHSSFQMYCVGDCGAFKDFKFERGKIYHLPHSFTTKALAEGQHIIECDAQGRPIEGSFINYLPLKEPIANTTFATITEIIEI